MNRIVPSAQLQPSAALPRQTLCSSKPAPLALEARLADARPDGDAHITHGAARPRASHGADHAGGNAH